MTDWMLYHFAEAHTTEEIQARCAWYEKQGKGWLEKFVEAKNNLAQAQTMIEVAEQQVRCYGSSIKELTEYAQKFGKGEA